MLRFSCFFLVLLVAVMVPGTVAIDNDHPLRQYLKSLHKQAGSETIKTQDHRAIKDFRKRFEDYRVALLEEKLREGQGVPHEDQ